MPKKALRTPAVAPGLAKTTPDAPEPAPQPVTTAAWRCGPPSDGERSCTLQLSPKVLACVHLPHETEHAAPTWRLSCFSLFPHSLPLASQDAAGARKEAERLLRGELSKLLAALPE